jgi:hypothetical protein
VELVFEFRTSHLHSRCSTIWATQHLVLFLLYLTHTRLLMGLISKLLSQWIEKPGERESDGETASGGVVRRHTAFIVGAWFSESQRNYYSSNSKGYPWQIAIIETTIMKQFAILWELLKRDIETQNKKTLGRTGCRSLQDVEVAQSSLSKNKNKQKTVSEKHNKKKGNKIR